MQTEVWKDIQGYPDYQVSNLGRVKSFKQGKVIIKKDCKASGDYARVGLMKDCLLKTVNVHRLVAITFIPNPERKPCVNHIDGHKRNNNVSNLEWCTYVENNTHALKTGLSKGFLGERNFHNKLTTDQVREIREMHNKMSTVKLGRLYGVASSTIGRIFRKETWRHLS